ncbi:BnaA06g24270D [Brassica napus]|uniref:Protein DETOXIFICATION n=1 Tax=Brassica napus TaxID=3708 RepID=A0A078F6T4_BRANA|nr:BnaA06g24270D [Brassica napus]
MRGRGREEDESESRVPLLESPRTMEENGGGLRKKLWVETKKLWQIVAPAMFTRITTYSTLVITQAFAGHLGDLELAAISIVYNVVVGFNFGLFLGMASALETLCGQAFGAKKYHMLGVYMQRSWIVLFVCCMLLLPTYLFTTPVLKWLGQPDDIAELSGVVSVWVIPLHFAFCLSFPLQRFLQCQLKSHVPAFGAGVGLVVHFLVCWLFVDGLKLGAVGTMATVSISWWVNILILLAYSVCGGCPLTWTGFSSEAFTGLWEFVKLSASSGVMLCLENWYYRILIIMTGNLQNARIAVDSLSICMTINGWENMIPLAFFAATGLVVNRTIKFKVIMNRELFSHPPILVLRNNPEKKTQNSKTQSLKSKPRKCDFKTMNKQKKVILMVSGPSITKKSTELKSVRVANELGAGNGKGARLATIVSVTQSLIIGLSFWVIIMLFHNQIALIFSSSEAVLMAVNKLSILLAFTILLNSVQPVLSGVAVGSGWQSYVAYINLGCYYCIGIPLGFLMGWVFNFGVMGIWAGMIFGGTAVQTIILSFITMRCDWEKEAQRASAHVNKWSNTIK